jgi:hypothetical protein
MTHILTEPELDEMEGRAAKALEVAPLPWEAWLETRYATGGSSFVRFGGLPGDNEMYVDVYLVRWPHTFAGLATRQGKFGVSGRVDLTLVGDMVAIESVRQRGRVGTSPAAFR